MKQLTKTQKEKRREYSRKWWAENKSVAAREKKTPVGKVAPVAVERSVDEVYYYNRAIEDAIHIVIGAYVDNKFTNYTALVGNVIQGLNGIKKKDNQ